MSVSKKAKVVKKTKQKVLRGLLKVYTHFGNTIVTLTDPSGNTLAARSCGAAKFKGSKKATPHAAQVAADYVADKAKNEFSMEEIDVEIRGPGSGRESVIRAFGSRLKVLSIRDVTPTVHNGCRQKKQPRK